MRREKWVSHAPAHAPPPAADAWATRMFADLLDYFGYMVNLLGIEHVGIGLAFDNDGIKR